MVKNLDDEKLWAEFHKYFDDFVVGDINKSLQIGIEVGTIILTTVGIECLGGYYTGKTVESKKTVTKGKPKRERKDFVEFMQEFMPSYRNYADAIYACIRNGLAHDYVINTVNKKTFVFGEPHLSPTPQNPNVFYLNRENYAKDFLEAQRKYFEKVESDQSLWDKAIQRLRSRKGFLTVRPENELVPPDAAGVARLMGTPPSAPQSSSSTQSLSTGVKPSHPSQGQPLSFKRPKSKP